MSSLKPDSAQEALSRYPSAPIDQDNVGIYQGWLAKELRLPKCQDCGKWHQPSRSMCPFCWSFNLAPAKVSGKGKVYIATLLRQGPATPGVTYPYPVVTVELQEQEGLRFTSTLIGVDFDDATQIGREVELDWIDRGGAPFPAFKPAKK